MTEQSRGFMGKGWIFNYIYHRGQLGHAATLTWLRVTMSQLPFHLWERQAVLVQRGMDAGDVLRGRVPV